MPTMTSDKMTISLLRAVFIATLGIVSWSLPLQITINQRNKECMYDKVNAGESVTVSVFVLSGTELKATVTFDGPIIGPKIKSGLELFDASNDFRPYPNDDGITRFSEIVDFEHLKPVHEEDDYDEMIRQLDALDEEINENDPKAAEKKRRKRERQRERATLERKKKERQKELERQKVREDGEPFQQTFKVPAAGWYRLCVHATWYQITTEIEMRKESELGGLAEDGHVLTYEQKLMAEEDKLLDQDTAAEEGIKDEDFQDTREKIKDLRKLLNEIQSMQQKERRRLIVHAETNEHSHSRMVLSSLVETVLFMAVTGFQVYTIRRWFSGAPALGR